MRACTGRVCVLIMRNDGQDHYLRLHRADFHTITASNDAIAKIKAAFSKCKPEKFAATTRDVLAALDEPSVARVERKIGPLVQHAKSLRARAEQWEKEQEEARVAARELRARRRKLW